MTPRRPTEFMPTAEPRREMPAPLSPFMPPDNGVHSPVSGCLTVFGIATMLVVLGLAKSCDMEAQLTPNPIGFNTSVE